jgi:aminopeptidase N
VPQSVWTTPDVADFLPGPFAQAGPIVEWFSQMVGPYPYEKLDHVQSSTRFGGMENASAIFYSDQAFRRRTLGVGLVAHEAAHQWFGNSVTEREWGHIWLSEGFATYFAQLWTRHSQGDSAFRAGMRQLRDVIVKSPVTAERPVIDTLQREYLKLLNSNSYQKGAWVLHMLRGLVGDSAFFRGVRDYYAAHRHGNAMTDDLRRAVERTSGQELSWFFDQWLRRPGVAELRAEWSYDPARRSVALRVEQGGEAPYRVPLTVAVTDAGGRVHHVRVEVPADRAATVALPLDLAAAPRGVALDPDVELLGTVELRAARAAP